MTNTQFKILQGIKKENTIVLEEDNAILSTEIDTECGYFLQVWISYEKGNKGREHKFTLNRN